MVSHDQIRALASALPETQEGTDRFGFSVLVKGKPKGFAWSWLERVHPKKKREPNDRVLALRVPNLIVKAAVLENAAPQIFTEPHYDGYPAILVNLDLIDVAELEPLFIEAWRCQAPPALVAAFDTQT